MRRLLNQLRINKQALEKILSFTTLSSFIASLSKAEPTAMATTSFYLFAKIYNSDLQIVFQRRRCSQSDLTSE
jgi:hypothetical protein